MTKKHGKNFVRWPIITHKRVFEEVKKLEKIDSLVCHTEIVPENTIAMVWWRKNFGSQNSYNIYIFWYVVGLERKYIGNGDFSQTKETRILWR